MRRALLTVALATAALGLAGCVPVAPAPTGTDDGGAGTDAPVEVLVTGDACPDAVVTSYTALSDGAIDAQEVPALEGVGITPSCAFELESGTTVVFVFGDDLDAAWERVDQALGDAGYTLQSEQLGDEASWVRRGVLVSGAQYADGDGPLQGLESAYIYLQAAPDA